MGMTPRDSPTNLVDNGSIRAVVAVSIVMTILATVLVGLRMRMSRGRPWALDDWLLIACLPFQYGVMITALLAVYIGGLGTSLSVIIYTNPQAVAKSLQVLVAVEILYSVLLTLIKLSVLSMYRRIFPTDFVLRATYVLGSLSLGWLIAIVIVTFLQCRPLSKMWDITVTEGYCLNRLGLFLGNAIPNIAIDVLILALPISEVARLQMNWLNKGGVVLVFLLGGFTVVVSGLRLKSGLNVLMDENADFTYLIGPLWSWTVTEPAMGIICACLPTVGGPFIGTVIRLISTRSMPSAQPHDRSRSSSKKSSFKTIVTIGGGSARGINRPAFSKSSTSGIDHDGSFERLQDSELGETMGETDLNGDSVTPTLWPKGYGGERQTTVSGRRSQSVERDDIPLTSITVKKEVSWMESKASVDDR